VYFFYGVVKQIRGSTIYPRFERTPKSIFDLEVAKGDGGGWKGTIAK